MSFDDIKNTPKFLNVNCPVTYEVYKFQPEVMKFSACCHTDPFPFNSEYFEKLGEKYFEHHPELIERKQALLSNIKHHHCKTCWKKEDNSLISLRILDGIREHRYSDITQSYPSRIEIWPGSTCNLACIMCNSENSNTFRKIHWMHDSTDSSRGPGIRHQQYIDKIRENSYFDSFKKNMLSFIERKISSQKRITIAYLGGEPTLFNDMFEQADRFIDAGKSNISNKILEIVTNGTASAALSSRLDNLFKKYKEAGWKVRVMISQDAAYHHAQVRFLTKFDRVETNFKKWVASNSGIDLVRSHTVLSNLNIPYIDVLANYIRSNFNELSTNLELTFNILDRPEWMSFLNMPKNLAEDSILRANDIFNEMKKQYPNTFHYDNRILLNVLSQLKPKISKNTYFKFKKTSDEVFSVLKNSDASFDPTKSFPHILEMINYTYDE